MDRALAVCSFAVLASACGGESADNDTTASASTAPPTATSTATLSGSGGTTAGSQETASVTGAAPSSTSSTTGGPSADCSGAFGEPIELFAVEMAPPQSFAITPDELELYYVVEPDGGVRIIERRARTSRSVSFGAPEAVPELLDLCPGVSPELAVGTIDLSPDGLQAYIACEEVVELPTTLVRARRTALGAPFTPDPTPIGIVGASFATADGLEGFANTPSALDQLDRHQRTSLTVPFGEAERLPITLRGPDPSNDGLWLFGTVPVAGTDSVSYHLAATSRSNPQAPFAEPTTEGFPSPPVDFSDYTPTISADCRSLYFLRLGASPVFSVMLAQR
ncbi:MAG TPA: hypothetical protein VI197_26310 [Polyangiaceae bacterium]